MKNMKISAFVLILMSTSMLHAQDNEWPAFPGLDYSERSIALIDQESFIVLSGAAITSFVLSEFVLKDVKDLNYYQTRFGIVGTTGGTVLIENFGIEKRLTHWFAIGLELNNQQWFYPQGNGFGIGLNTYYRWYLLGRKKISPFLEYGAGVFHGFSKFPPDGQQFSFNLTTQIGVEYTFDNENKIRLGYGHLHQSTNDLIVPNPGEDGNGFNVTYLWFWE